MIDVPERLGSRRFWIRVFGTLTLTAVAIGILWFSWTYAGPVATIAYLFLFVIGASLIPGMIMTLRDMTPGLVAKLMFAFGQLAWGGSWLVQHRNGWELCPARERDGTHQYYLKDQWYDVIDASNRTRLGWAGFGILWHREEDELVQYREDEGATDYYDNLTGVDDPTDGDGGIENVLHHDLGTTASLLSAAAGNGESGADSANADSETMPDGGSAADMEVAYDERVGLKPGVWVVHLRDYWTDRIEPIGGVSLLEDVERVAQREEALANSVSQNRLMIGSVIGLVLGAGTAYVAMAMG